MQRNIAWAVLLPVAKWAVSAGVLAGGSYLGYRRLEQYRESTGQQLDQRREAALSARAEQEARTRQTLTMLNPVFIAGTIAMTGLGTFVMLRGMRRSRMEREYY